ncbi:MAG: S41 family peptidase [Acidobacteriota bacterium]|nr:S41 family peptidase [Acidobacteriota bacterium]
MRTFVPLPILLLLVATSWPAAALEARLPRHPAPSPDGSEIAFSWQGDIWLVPAQGGEARRLTAHPAADRFPVWSPDGRWIAFQSWRYGNGDVFVLPYDGSAPPRRLTFASTDDRPVDFSPSGLEVLFVSRRDLSIRRAPGLYRVWVEGSTPVLEQRALGDNAAYSPDGQRLAFVRGGTYWWRRGYRGAANREIWLRRADGSLEPLTDFDGDDDHPLWVDADTLIFLSSRNGRKNLFRLEMNSGRVTPLTHFDQTDVRFPRISADGSLVAFEVDQEIRLLRPTDGEQRRVRIEVAPDWTRPPVEERRASSGAEELVISPDGKLAAFIVHGEVFVTGIRSKKDQQIATPPTVQVTRTPQREQDLLWHPDSKSLWVTSDRRGNNDIYRLSPADPKRGWLENLEFHAEAVVAGPDEEHAARISPDGRKLAYLRGKGDLLVRDLDSGDQTLIHEHWSPAEFRWSPDSRWLAYATNDVEYNSEVWIVPATGGEAYNVSRHPDIDTAPRWSADGRRLTWLSRRHADTLDVWSVWLRREDAERSAEQWLALWQSGKKGKKKDGQAGKAGEKAARKKKKKKTPKEEAAAPEPDVAKVEIDLQGLWRRAEPLTRLPGDEGDALLTPDGRRLVFTAVNEKGRDIFISDWRGRKPKRLTTSGKAPRALQFDESGKTLFYLSATGTIQRVSLEGKAGDPVPFSARYTVDNAAERRQLFDEAWRALSEWFYDPHFHGVDWQAMRRRYRPWAMDASDHADFADVMNLMLGELNASHMGYRPRRPEGGAQTGWIGALFDASEGGPGILVSEVLDDSPAARTDVALLAGERILAVDGREVTETTNIYALFENTVGRRLPLLIAGVDGEKRRVVIEPVAFSRQRQLRYRQWTRRRRAMVDRLSGGRLGYLHIQGMSMPSFEEFERDLYAAGHGKQGLLIDVRSNGGGWTTDYLMAVLNVRRHAYTIPRDADPATRAYPQGGLPLAAWTRPAAALCNEESYSNAEIFSRAFRNLKRGPLIGTPTFGAVISTSGRRLLNGDWVRLPLRGWYDALTGENQENHGVQPDLLVTQPPAEDTLNDKDTQLAAAVELLLERLENDPRAGAW